MKSLPASIAVVSGSGDGRRRRGGMNWASVVGVLKRELRGLASEGLRAERELELLVNPKPVRERNHDNSNESGDGSGAPGNV